MFYTIQTTPIQISAGTAYVNPAVPVDSIPAQQISQSNSIGNFSFEDANNKLLEEQIMQQRMLNDILYTSNIYSGWDNIPLYDVPKIDLNMFKAQSNQYNLLNIDFSKWNFDKISTESDIADKTRNAAIDISLVKSGYDYVLGLKLAKLAKKNHVGYFDGQCAKHVKTSIKECNLGKYVAGHATNMDEILDKNPNFKRVNISIEDAKKTPGIVLVYNAGVAGYNKKYGHTEITGGDGCAYSGGRTKHIRPGFIAYVPVSKSSNSYTA